MSSTIIHVMLVALIVLGINLLPAFGPPTWALLVVAHWQWRLNPVLLVVIGVVGAGAGRYVLATSVRLLRRFFPARYLTNLHAVETRLAARRHRVVALLALFVVSPLPSAQLFCAAGLLDFRIAPLTLAFMAGRVVTYSLYLSAAVVADHTFGSVLGQVWGSSWSIALQVVLIVLVAILPMVPWTKSPTAKPVG